MALFKKIVYLAALTGLISGLLLTALQQVQVAPLILVAEGYENELVHATQELDAWQPENGLQRLLLTGFANIVLAFGFSMLLTALIRLRQAKLDWRHGLLWGMAGFAVCFASPSLGLPPEIPGSESAALIDRQVWWLAAVFTTTLGLWLIVFSNKIILKLTGLSLSIIPHWIGAPKPDVQGIAPHIELEHAFILASSLTNLIFWLVLGAVLGFFYQRVMDG